MSLNRVTKLVWLLLAPVFIVGCSSRTQPIVPQEPASITHTVRYQGETLSLIARWYTGKSGTWKEISAFNPSIKPERLKIGDKIKIPTSLTKESTPLPSSFVKPRNQELQNRSVANLETSDSRASLSPELQEEQREFAIKEESSAKSTKLLPPPVESEKRRKEILDELLD